MVSMGTFEQAVLLKVLFAIESPTDASPFDELEWCCPCVVFNFERLFFGVKNRIIAFVTCETEEEMKQQKKRIYDAGHDKKSRLCG